MTGKILALKNISARKLREIYKVLLMIRKVEEKIIELYSEQEIRCPTHLYIGQEAIATGVCANLKKTDYIVSNHRGHGHYLAKGGDLNAMMAELYGKRTGCAKGRGGSMHLSWPRAGMIGSTSIVGGCIPIAVGMAFAFKMRGSRQISAAFFGDAAVEEGAFHESLNFASLHKLPVLFICENNFYAVQSPIKNRQVGEIYKKVRGYEMKGLLVDGTDVLEVFKVVREAVKQLRQGKGPILIECQAYRWMEHVGPNFDYNLGYRTKEELEKWMKKCPLKRYTKFLLDNNILSKQELKRIDIKIEREMENAIEFARKSPLPTKRDLIP